MNMKKDRKPGRGVGKGHDFIKYFYTISVRLVEVQLKKQDI